VWRRDGVQFFDASMATLNAASALLSMAARDVGTVAVSGAVGKLLWQALSALLARHPGLTVVVADGTRLFVDATDLALFARRGGRLFAQRGIQLLGIALNPFSPFGGSFAPHAFLDEARSALPGRIVTDVMLPFTAPCQADEDDA
jgi:hypothetical protein